MKIPKEQLKEELHKDFEEFVEEREKFVSGFSPKDKQAWKCSIHNIWINRDSLCPECEYEKRQKERQKEIMESGMFGKTNSDTKKQLEKADQIKSSLKEKRKERNKIDTKAKKEKYQKDEDFREYQNKASKKATRKNQLRRLEHSIDI